MAESNCTLDQLARLAFSKFAWELSATTRSAVTRARDIDMEGSLFTEPAALARGAAFEALYFAVVSERLRGTPWRVISGVLSRPPDQVQSDYADAEGDFVTDVMFPIRQEPDAQQPWKSLPEGLDQPERLARFLDRCVSGDQEMEIGSPSSAVRGSGPVSSALRPASEEQIIAEAALALYEASRRRREGGLPSPVDYPSVDEALSRLRRTVSERMAAWDLEHTPVTSSALVDAAFATRASGLPSDGKKGVALRDSRDDILPSLTEEAMARLSFFAACRDASDLGRRAAIRRGDTRAMQGSLVRTAATMVRAAERVVTTAVVADVNRSVRWHPIGDALYPVVYSAEAAQAQYQPAVDSFHDTILLSRLARAGADLGRVVIPQELQSPDPLCRSLDRWVTGAGVSRSGPSSQSSGLHPPVSSVLHDVDPSEALAQKGKFLASLQARVNGAGAIPSGVSITAARERLHEVEEEFFSLREAHLAASTARLFVSSGQSGLVPGYFTLS